MSAPALRASRPTGVRALVLCGFISASSSACDGNSASNANQRTGDSGLGSAVPSGVAAGTTPSAANSGDTAKNAANSGDSAKNAAPTATASATKPEPYQGPTGVLTGTIRIRGDAAPNVKHAYAKECAGDAAATYGKLFRVGQDHALADALVAVTGYKGFVPPKAAAIAVTITRCAFSTRTIAMTDGQHLEVKNLDPLTSYLPRLDGARMPATIVAIPGGDPVKIYSRGYGRYWLRDDMARGFMVAHVFHFHYGTTAVTALDGKYRIEGVPTGKVDVSAMLPSANLLSTTKSFEVRAGDNALDLELKFDAKKNVPEKLE
ncbi:MAG: hypothetical protein EXR75_12120 [Myxococcales bacterium]|nr:hypothetical protein [Myxococcales bacterium]